MNLSKFFIDRPIFAAVLSVLIFLAGLLSIRALPISEYPEVVPPTVVVRAQYPGASPRVIAETVATPIEEQINGVEGMLYMSSQATTDGVMTLNVTFRLGTDPDKAQQLVQNRVSQAEPRLPEEVRRLGVTTVKSSPDLTMVVHITSPNGRYDMTYLRNYAVLNVKDRLARIDGVGQVQLFGSGDYSMRIWLDPQKVAEHGLSPGDVVREIRAQNVQAAAGVIGASPNAPGLDLQLSVNAQGRLQNEEQFGEIIVKTAADGAVVRLKDIARIELGAADYALRSLLNGKSAVAVPVFQAPGSNAIAIADRVQETMREIKQNMPEGVDYSIVYDTTQFVRASIKAVISTLLEAVALVVLVVIVFLQTWRASIIPLVAVPISIVGTFAVMYVMGFSINALSLFGLVLAIGIVVDDAIVVVENVERYLAQGMTPAEAAHKTMDEVGGALLAIALVLCAVFIPTAFISGLQGTFYQQFAVTIAASTAISCFVSLTLSPAMSAILLKPHKQHDPNERHGVVYRLGAPVRWFFHYFNAGFDWLSRTYGRVTSRLIRLAVILLIVYAGLIALTAQRLMQTPTGLVPQLDRGYFIVAMQLPPGASLQRTDAVLRRANELLQSRPGVAHTVAFAGLDGATFTIAPNAGVAFVTLSPFKDREKEGLTTQGILADLRQQMFTIPEAFTLVIEPPAISGIGNGGGLKGYVQDRGGRGLAALEGAAWTVAGSAAQLPFIEQPFTLFSTKTPQIYADIDRTKAEMLGVPITRIFETLSIYMGSAYINDFNLLGRTFRVTAQADNPFRLTTRDVASLKTRNADGEMVPIGSVAAFRDTTGAYRVPRYNLYPAAEVQLSMKHGYSTGQGIAAVEKIAAERLPAGFGFEWTEIALQEKLAGNTAIIAFGLAVVFVFLLLAALYESWLLPLAVILIVPMCILAAMFGVNYANLDRNILVDIGLVVLVGLAAKNAILIVEFAKQAEEEGMHRRDAAIAAARTRLRPILMTSMAFILGVLPLTISVGAGAEMRQAMGIAVFSGMLGVTVFGLIFTPVFYVMVRWLAELRGGRRKAASAPGEASGAHG